MQPNYISIANLFGVQTRYTVPLFQRPYVWSRSDQWEPLWDDLQQLLERVLSSELGKPVAGHFLGTVVLEQTAVSIVNLPRREVIDGQQRLTTLQILLKAAEHALSVVGQASTDVEGAQVAARCAEQLGYLTKNGAISVEEEAFKVWPTNEDRPPFKSVMESTPRTGVTGEPTRMAEAYGYFRETFIKWLTGPNLVHRAQSLASGLKDHVRLIVLDLDDTDEPQAIFETLNAHGTPLLPSDLMKNWILWEATKQKLPVAPLYEEYWRPFDRDATHWRDRIGVGHAARPRVDMFFQNWLTRHTRRSVSPKHIYDAFLRYMANDAPRLDSTTPDIHAVLEDIRDDALRFRKLQSPTGETRFDDFLRRMDRLDVVVLYPFVLAVMGRQGSDQRDRDLIATAIESWLVRRMVCNLQTRGYGALALDLLDVLANTPADQPAAPAVIEALNTVPQSALQWPDDALFQREWCSRRFYGSLRKDRVLMMLQAIEERLQRQGQTGKVEPVMKFDFSKLTIEHVLPQTWRTHWTLSEGVEAYERDIALHGVGNLTLVSAKLNPSMSNAPWLPSATSKLSKREALNDHSKLELNARLVKEHPGDWNESMMRNRAAALFAEARHIWPSADALRNAAIPKALDFGSV
ncbi:hypothetical protein D3C72_356070 [compost metagenome]